LPTALPTFLIALPRPLLSASPVKSMFVNSVNDQFFKPDERLR
jgi:hypothetical protein